MTEDALDGDAPFVLFTGAAGTGRTTALARFGERAARGGRPVAAVRCTARGDVLPVRFVGGEEPVRLPERAAAPFGPVPGAAADPELARRAAVAVAARVPAGGALLIDDAHLLDPDSLAVLRALVPVLGAGRRCVCTARVLPPRLAGLVSDLRGAGLLAQVRLGPLSPRALERELASALGAVPEPALTARVRELGRGLPAAQRDVVDALRAAGAIRVVDRRAYLTRPHALVEPDQDGRLVAAVRALGEQCWAAAKAVAVLAPLGAAVPRLLADALGVAEDTAGGLLDGLRAAGVLHRGRRGTSWRFVVPLVGAALAATLGPFERRRYSAIAVTAVWSGQAACDDADHFADRIAEAGFLIDAERAYRALVEHAAAATGERALRWLTAAAELADDEAVRADILLRHAGACAEAGDHARGLAATRRLLERHAAHLDAEAVQTALALTADALAALCDHQALTELAESSDPVTRALALTHLDRWREARALLDADPSWRSANPVSARLGERTLALAELWTGSSDRFAAQQPPTTRARLAVHLDALLTLGDAREAARLLAASGVPEADLPEHVRSLLAAARGAAPEAVDLARRALATGTAHSASVATAATLLAARGELPAARHLIATARTTPAPLSHLLDIADAHLDRAHGDEDAARARLLRCAAQARSRGLTVGLDLVHSELADLAAARGDDREAAANLAALDSLPRTDRTDLLTLLTRATVTGDPASALACERRARARANPLEQASCLARLSAHNPALLAESYAVLGSLGALLHRAWARNLMRDNAIPVPGRQESVAENEYLLAILAAGGLTNKQLAATLRTSDKSVEGRLSRLFTRTGYRSRIELSTALLNGDFQTSPHAATSANAST